MIIDPKMTGQLPEVIAEGGYYGMQTFDQHLVRLALDGTVSIRDAKAGVWLLAGVEEGIPDDHPAEVVVISGPLAPPTRAE